jgi:hypothetical protein
MWDLDTIRQRDGTIARRYFNTVPRRERLIRRLEAMNLTTPEQTARIMTLFDGATDEEQAILAESEIRDLLRLTGEGSATAERDDANNETCIDKPVVVNSRA